MAQERLTDEREPVILDGDYRHDYVADALGDTDDEVRADIRRILADVGESEEDTQWKLMFYRQQLDGKKSYMFKVYDPNVDYMDKIRDEYGRGNYVCRIYMNGVLKKSPKFSIDTPAVKPEPPPSGIDSDLDRRMRRIEELLANSQNKGGMQETLGVLSMARELFQPTQAASPGLTMKDVLTMLPSLLPALASFRELFGGGSVGGIKEALGLIEMARGLVPDSGGSSDSSLFSVLQNVAPQFVEMMNRQQQTELANRVQRAPIPTQVQQVPSPAAALQRPAPVTVQAPTPSQNPQPAPTRPEAAQPLPPELEDMRMQLIMLCQMAAHNDDVQRWADVVLTATPPEREDQLLDLLESEDPVAALAKIHAGVANHRDWFMRLRDAILSRFEPDEPDEEQAPVDKPENATDTPEHGADKDDVDGDTGRQSGDAGDVETDAADRQAVQN